MKRRNFLQIPMAAMFAAVANAAPSPWSGRVLKGGFDGTAWNAGFAVTLTDNWKTYWRVPGDGGIAPAFEIGGDNIKQSWVDYPTPTRFRDAAGLTNGYKSEVIFPFLLEPLDASRPVNLSFKTFFGVCEVVCIPAQFVADISFDPAKSDAPDQMLISQWRKKVPVVKPQSVSGAPVEPVSNAQAVIENDKPVLVLELNEIMTDIFVEGDAKHYFGEPSIVGLRAILQVHGAKSLEELRATRLRITLVSANAALEQMIEVD